MRAASSPLLLRAGDGRAATPPAAYHPHFAPEGHTKEGDPQALTLSIGHRLSKARCGGRNGRIEWRMHAPRPRGSRLRPGWTVERERFWGFKLDELCRRS
jgi:hypothetical protein